MDTREQLEFTRRKLEAYPTERKAIVRYLTGKTFASQLRWLVKQTQSNHSEHKIITGAHVEGLLERWKGTDSDTEQVGEEESIPHASPIFISIHTHPHTTPTGIDSVTPSNKDLRGYDAELEYRLIEPDGREYPPFKHSLHGIIGVVEQEPDIHFNFHFHTLSKNPVLKLYDEDEMIAASHDGLQAHLRQYDVFAHSFSIPKKEMLKAAWTVPEAEANKITDALHQSLKRSERLLATRRG